MMPFGLSAVELIDAIVVLLLLEIMGLIVYRSLTHQGMRVVETLAFHGAGLAMLLGLRTVAANGSPALFGGVMLASLGLHLWHVVQRWER